MLVGGPQVHRYKSYGLNRTGYTFQKKEKKKE